MTLLGHALTRPQAACGAMLADAFDHVGPTELVHSGQGLLAVYQRGIEWRLAADLADAFAGRGHRRRLLARIFNQGDGRSAARAARTREKLALEWRSRLLARVHQRHVAALIDTNRIAALVALQCS